MEEQRREEENAGVSIQVWHPHQETREWTDIGQTSDGVTRKFYTDGLLVKSIAEVGQSQLTRNSKAGKSCPSNRSLPIDNSFTV